MRSPRNALSSPDDEVVAHALLGDEARKFKESDLYRCMLGFAEQERDAARLALESVDPADTKEITRLQAIVARMRDFGAWLDWLIAQGNEALEAWRNDHRNE